MLLKQSETVLLRGFWNWLLRFVNCNWMMHTCMVLICTVFQSSIVAASTVIPLLTVYGLDWTGLDHLHCWRSMTWTVYVQTGTRISWFQIVIRGWFWWKTPQINLVIMENPEKKTFSSAFTFFSTEIERHLQPLTCSLGSKYTKNVFGVGDPSWDLTALPQTTRWLEGAAWQWNQTKRKREGKAGKRKREERNNP